MFQVKIKNGPTFSVKPSQTILEAAILAGINLPFGCKSGSCGSCKTKILEGQAFHEEIMPGALNEAEQKTGQHLLCKTYATSDLIIEDTYSVETNFPPKISPVRVESINQLNHDVIQVILKLPAGESVKFQAGQYLEFILADGSRRAFSMANCPGDDLIELHIRVIEGGKFTNYILKDMPEKSLHRIELPLGQFYLRDAENPIIFVAGGTGFAPIKSIINYMIKTNNNRKIYLYRGMRFKKDLYQSEVIDDWYSSGLDISVFNVFSDEEVDGNKKKLVHQQVLDDYQSLHDFQVYCCGAPPMIETAYHSFIEYGLQNENFFSDAFTFAPR